MSNRFRFQCFFYYRDATQRTTLATITMVNTEENVEKSAIETSGIVSKIDHWKACTVKKAPI